MNIFERFRIKFAWEPVRFVIVGGVNTSVGLSVIFGAKFFFGFGDVAANAVGYSIGLTVSFLLNRSWTFRDTGPVWAAAIRFFLAFAASYALNLSTVLLLIHRTGMNAYLSQSIGVPVYTICFYLLSKFIVFRKQELAG